MGTRGWAYRWGGGSWRLLVVIAVLLLALATSAAVVTGGGAGSVVVLAAMSVPMAFTAGARYERDAARTGERSRVADAFVRPDQDDRLRRG